MSKRSERFNRSMRSLDEFVESFGDASKIAALSDRGTGVSPVQNMEEVLSDANGRDARSTKLGHRVSVNGRDARSTKTKLHAAEMRLYRAGRGYLVPVLRLIVRYGSARYLSLEKISRAQYFRHRDALLRFFSCDSGGLVI